MWEKKEGEGGDMIRIGRYLGGRISSGKNNLASFLFFFFPSQLGLSYSVP